jgi:hypothetical protein
MLVVESPAWLVWKGGRRVFLQLMILLTSISGLLLFLFSSVLVSLRRSIANVGSFMK